MAKIIGPYTLVEKIGEGGMGVVYRAEQQSPVKRSVALKLLKSGLETKPLIARFEAERQALAMMDHHGIAKVYDAGETETGQPYVIMELVAGLPIDHYCESNQLTREARLRLFIRVCDAVQHAHHKGIIHRDLKPTNILVDKDQPKIIDFGIAKALQGHATLTDKTLVTRFSQVLGTPAYMSPEQLDITGFSLDTRTDIYSLGVILYQLLTDRLPFDRERLEKASAVELERILMEEDPPKPSTHVRALEGDLDWIVMKALEKDHNNRYANADAFAADVSAFLEDKAVSARPPSRGYLLRKSAQRHRKGIAVGLSMTALFLIGFALTAGQAIRATHAEAAEAEKGQLAALRLEASDAMLDFITNDVFRQAGPSMNRDIKLISAVDHASAQVNEKFAQQPRVRCFMHLRLANIYEMLGNFDEADAHAAGAQQAVDALSKEIDSSDRGAQEDFLELSTDIQYQNARTTGQRHRYRESVVLFEKALETHLRCRNPRPTVTQNIKHGTAIAYAGVGNLKEGARTLAEVLQSVPERIDGKANPEHIDYLGLLAGFHWNLGQQTDAATCLAKAERLLPEMSRDDAYMNYSVLHQLAFASLNMDPEKSVLHGKEALAVGEIVFGDKADTLIPTRGNVGKALFKLGRYEEAYPYLKEAWKGTRLAAGPGNEWTLIVLKVLIECVDQMGLREEYDLYLERMTRDAHEGPGGDSHYLASWAYEAFEALWVDAPEKLKGLRRMLAGEESWPADQVEVLVPRGSDWHYHAGSAPDRAWALASFDASGWTPGKAPLGYGEDEIATEVPFGPNADAKWPSTFLRHTFAWDTENSLKKLRVRIRRDDGVVVHLNGKRLFQHHLPETAPTPWDTFATSEVGKLEEKLYYVEEIDSKQLQAFNALAVQVHQCNGKSSDVFFDLELEGLLESE